ncbi:MAG: SRPBCC family protein [Gemmatimonadota bacterium]
MKWGARIFGVLAGILLLYLLVGLLLPGTWTATEEAVLPAPPSAVYPFLNRISAWEAWTPFPETGLEVFGPPDGVGAGVRWDDPRYGKGEARIVEVRQDTAVGYEVLIEGGALTIRGSLTLISEGDGSRVRWTENGDFGWNPLMGYAARGMASSQGEAMKSSLVRLAAAVARRKPDPTAP